MNKVLLFLFLLTAGSASAQATAGLAVPAKAANQLEKMLKKTQDALVTGRRAADIPAESRPQFNKVLVQSTTEFVAITKGTPTKEAYYASLDAGLAKLAPLARLPEDRQHVAAYYQDLLDIVGLDSSEGRLNAFVEAAPPAKAKR
ncbi:DUF4844 domain-containing protein [Hymenobacter ruricola]|uniref:DUF4844 domain-containing protein n=1 Tax=Hymenobacter ruricola TaxID=2791023 RepID=A0ABS0I833_9BACT|nr:DUF4844 domain-containing protein [Hymenobacter ruricola]MBF9222853.1 DUF4844 domain-containing protein [Hymenobacter ruricola]